MSDAGAHESAPAERVRELLEAVVAGLRVEAEVEIVQRADEIQATLQGDDLGLVIGRHGQTIDAIQHLAFKVAVQGETEPQRVVVDAAGYRERRRAILERQADEAADAAERSGDAVALDAMSAGERKVVHEYLKGRPGIETYSEGTEPDRHLVVKPLRFT
jgi:spoIIIJ-associated protein